MDGVLQAHDVCKSFGGLTALANVSVTIEEKKITGIIGPNGAGKTTLFNVLSGFIKPDKGDVFLKSRNVTNYAPHLVVGLGLARTWQGLRLFENLTVLENIVMAIPYSPERDSFRSVLAPWTKNKRKRDRAEEILELVRIGAKSSTAVKELSYAEQKLVAIGRLLATDADVLLLDEPTSGLDMRAVELIFIPLIRTLVEQLEKTVCIVEHSIKLVFDLCDTVFCLSDGQILASGPPDVLRENEALNQAFFQMK